MRVDNNLDKQLKALGRKVESQLFKDWRFTQDMRFRVHAMVSQGKKPGSKHLRFIWIAAAAGIMLVLFLGAPLFKGYLLPEKELAQNWLTTVEERRVDLDGRAPEEVVTAVRMTPQIGGPGQLLALIWANSEIEGRWKVVFSEPLDGWDDLLPMEVIRAPGSRQNLVVLSSRTREADYVHYMVLGYDGLQVNTYAERSYAPLPTSFRGQIVKAVYRIGNKDIMISPGPSILLQAGDMLFIESQQGTTPGRLVHHEDGILERHDNSFLALRPGKAVIKITSEAEHGPALDLQVHVIP